MIILIKYIIILILIVLFFYTQKENLTLGNYTTLKHVPPVKLYELGFSKKRSRRFSKMIRDRFLALVPPNSIKAGDTCFKEFPTLCKGTSTCIYNKGEYFCAAGEDGINEMGLLNFPNNLGNYNNGDEAYWPIKKTGCLNTGKLKKPKNYRCNKFTNKFEYYNPQPIPDVFIPEVSMARVSFQPPMPLTKNVQDNCLNAFDTPNENIQQIEDNYANFCKNKETGDICALEPYKRFGKPFCKNVICPEGYKLSDSDSNICESKETSKSCVLESNITESIDKNKYDEDDDDDDDDEDDKNKLVNDKYGNYPVCGGLNYFLSVNNVNLKGGTDILFEDGQNYKLISNKECAYKCLEDNECHAYTITKDKDSICKLKKPPFSKDDIEEKKNTALHYKLPLNYKFNENKNIKLNNINNKIFTNKSYLECANECDKLSECVGFTVNKDKNATNCNLKNKIVKSGLVNITDDKKTRLFEKIIKKNKLCPAINFDNLDKKIDDNVEYVNNFFDSEFKYFIDQKKNDLSKDNKHLKNKITNEYIFNLLEHDNIVVWENINIICNKIRIRKLDNNILNISILQILSFNDNKIVDIVDDSSTILKMSSYLENHNIDKLKNSKYSKDIFEYSSTKDGNNDYIDIILKNPKLIYKIIIYNKINPNYHLFKYNFSDKFYPFEIILMKDDEKISIAKKYKKNIPLKIFTNKKEKINIYNNINKNISIQSDEIDKKCNILQNNKNYKINTGFSYNNQIYLIKNTKLANKNLIKIAIINPTWKNRKRNNIIIVGIDWKVRSKLFKRKIDSAIAYNNIVILITDDKYTKIDILKKKELEGYPKLISKEWKNLPKFFHSGITCAIQIENNNCILFKNNNCIKYSLDLIEAKNSNNIISNFDIKMNIQEFLPNFTIKDWDTIINYNNYMYIFKNNIMQIYNIKNQKLIKSIDMIINYPKLWTIKL